MTDKYLTDGRLGIIRDFQSPVFFEFYLIRADLRHSHISLLIDMGFSAVAIADRVGHESIEITYRYAHLFPSKQAEMADRLDDLGKGDF